MSPFTLRPFCEHDWAMVWQIISPILKEGETYTFDPDSTEEEAYKLWITLPKQTFVAVQDNTIIGTYYIKPNQPALGSHICNCGYMIHAAHRGKGVARSLCQHSLTQAKAMGFRGMQFNAVVSTNHIAVNLWLNMGFKKIGIVPEGFYSHTQGYVDSYIMFKRLT